MDRTPDNLTRGPKMRAADLQHPAVGAALATAAQLTGMEAVYIGALDDTTFTFERVHGGWDELVEGLTIPRADSFCHRLLSGAPPATADAANDPAYRDVPVRTLLGVTSYVGVPVYDGTGHPVGTFCGIDRRSVPVDPDILRTLADLSKVVAAHWRSSDDLVIRRVASGWQVAGEVEGDLTSAMVLADLLAGELQVGGRPPRGEGELDETTRLRVAVSQLEHALAARVTVEQAIGVLAERQHLQPRAAFERLRKAARSRGRKVHDLAKMVVASVGDPSVPLPPELGPRPRP